MSQNLRRKQVQERKDSVCAVCTLRGLRFGVTDSPYLDVTRTARETDGTKSTFFNVKELDSSF